MQTSKFNMLTALAVVMLLCGLSGNTVQAQTRAELKANGFIPATGDWSKYYVLVPDNTVPFTDVYVGAEVKVIRAKGEGPQLAPVKVFVGGVEVAPASKAVFLSPTTNPNYLRVHWIPKLLPAEAQGPGFGRADGDDWFDVDGNAFGQFYVPKTSTGAFITSGYTLMVFASQDVRTTALKSDEYKTVKEKNDKAKDTEKPGSPKEKDEKKDDKKKDEGKPDDKKDVPPAKKE
jgi:hypothetical protein